MSRPYLNTRSRAGAAPLWTSLPHGVLVQSMRLLPLDARACAACVCRAWQDAAADPDALASLWFERRCALALNGDIIGRMCARAGAALREVRLDTPACYVVTAARVLAALRQGGCAGVQRLVLRTQTWMDSDALTAEQAQQLAVACPALEHAKCTVRCESAEDVAAVCASLPGPLELDVIGQNAARAALALPAQMAALVMTEGGFTLDARCVAALGDALRTNTTLTSMFLVGAGIGDAGAASLGVALRSNAMLTTLYICGNDVGDEGAAALADALRTNASLTQLDLNDNHIGDAGAASLSEMLRTNATLTELDLGANGIGDAAAASLSETLSTNTTLADLYLSHNDGVGDEGAAALADALRTNATLKYLWLAGTRIGDAGTAALVEALRTNTTLHSLLMDGDVNLVDRRG